MALVPNLANEVYPRDKQSSFLIIVFQNDCKIIKSKKNLLKMFSNKNWHVGTKKLPIPNIESPRFYFWSCFSNLERNGVLSDYHNP